jgi:hypothetical protein
MLVNCGRRRVVRAVSERQLADVHVGWIVRADYFGGGPRSGCGSFGGRCRRRGGGLLGRVESPDASAGAYISDALQALDEREGGGFRLRIAG